MDRSLEVLALRQQVAMLKRKRPRPSLNHLDRFCWTTLRYIWPRSYDVLVISKPETVVRWHRVGFRLYCRWRSRPRGGPPKVSVEIRTLISRERGPYRHAILDHDSKFDVDVIAFLKVTGLEPKRTGLRAPAPHPRLNKQRRNRERAEATAPLSEAWAARRCRSPLLIRFSKSEP